MNDTAERLQNYYPEFQTGVIDTVAEVADYQKGFASYKDYFAAIDLPEPSTFIAPSSSGVEVSVVDIKPCDYDETEATAIYLPMANPLDANMLFQTATIARTIPNKRVIAFGNPSGLGFGLSSQPNRKYRKSIAEGNLLAVTEPTVQYLRASGVEQVRHVGYSYGAELAASALYASSAYGQLVGKTVHIEPVSVKPRSVARLGAAFFSTNKALSDYVEASGVEAFRNARDDAVNPLNYVLGLGRLTNIAVARGLAHGDFVSHLDGGLTSQALTRRYDFPDKPKTTATIVWGSASELAADNMVIVGTMGLFKKFGEQIRQIRLEGQKHALANDIHLQAALVAQGLTD